MLGGYLFIVATVSTLFMGYVCNNYGRVKACSICLVVGGLGTLLAGFAPNYWVACIGYGLAGFLLTYLNFSSIILNEIGDEKFKNFSNGLYGIFWSCTELIWVGIGYWIKKWRIMLYALGGF